MQTSLTVYLERGIYAACEGVHVATYVAVQIPEKKTHSLCEVEIFQTKTSKCLSTYLFRWWFCPSERVNER